MSDPHDRTLKDLSIPSDGNSRPVAVVFGYDPVTDLFRPLEVVVNPDGLTYTLKTTAEFSGSISVGDVIIRDSINALDKCRVINGRQMNQSDDNPMYKDNIKTELTYVSTDPYADVATMKEYPSSALPGSPAKLTTYTYDAYGRKASITVTDTTV